MYAENIIIFPILSRRIRNSQVIFIELGRGEAYTWREKSNRWYRDIHTLSYIYFK